MVEGIVEGFENKEVKPPRIKSERIDIPPDTAVEYAVSLIKYRISTKLEQVRAAHDAEDIQLIAHEAEALSRVKSEIAKGDIDATIRFLNEEDVRVDNKLAMVLEKAKTLGFDPKKRINLTDSAKAKAASEVSYYLTRKNDIERSIKALGGKQFSRERSPI
jgi:hypothetical protein